MYLTLCASNLELADDLTFGDFSSELAAEADRFEALTPPAQLSEWHLLNIEAYRTAQAVADTQPKDDVVDFDSSLLIAAESAFIEKLREAAARVPKDVLQQMIEAHCINPDFVPDDDEEVPDDHGNDIDRAALVALYNATEGGSWTTSTNWLSGRPLDEWHGVTTDSGGRVTALNLVSNSLVGALPAALGDLTNLRTLILWSNDELTGPIPAWLGDLTNLRWLILGGNGLTGEIPPELAGLSNLTSLDLRSNGLTGEIPPELAGLSNLQRLYLNHNRLTGEIPPELASLSNLTELYLNDNRLTGEIPPELGRLSNLMELGLYANQLTGEIPPELAGLSNLMELSLYANQLTGEIPPELGGLSNLTTLLLNSNRLTGGIPPELGGLSNLDFLWLRGNQLTGCIPEGLRDIEANDLGDLDLPDCGLEGRPAAMSANEEVVEKELIVFNDLNWASAQVQNRIAQYIVDKGYGYPTDVVFGATLPLFQGLRRGDSHVTMEIWLPDQDEAWMEARAAGEVISVGQSLGKDWQSSFVIPAYLAEQHPDLDSVDDLKDDKYKELFATAETGGKARLVSCVIGWACEEINAKQIEGYGLSDHVHVVNPGDWAAATADLYGSYEKGEPWLGYQWGTSDPALLLDLVRLEEPEYSDECWFTTKACAYEDATILIAVHPDLTTRAPEVVAMLRAWDFNTDIFKEVARWQSDNADASTNDAALWWLKGNTDLWSGWVTAEAAEAITTALDANETPDGWPTE